MLHCRVAIVVFDSYVVIPDSTGFIGFTYLSQWRWGFWVPRGWCRRRRRYIGHSPPRCNPPNSPWSAPPPLGKVISWSMCITGNSNICFKKAIWYFKIAYSEKLRMDKMATNTSCCSRAGPLLSLMTSLCRYLCWSAFAKLCLQMLQQRVKHFHNNVFPCLFL